MSKYRVKAVKTRYWRPGDDYLKIVSDSLENIVKEDDVVVLSEKAISTALGNLIDESSVNPGLMARFLAKYWMRYVWGYFLGPLSRLRTKTVYHLRSYPLNEGSAHKEVALRHAGCFLRSLMYGSEGGMDASNLPYSYVSLPLKNAEKIANEIREHIKTDLGKNVAVMIVDTDKTYSLKGFHFTHRLRPIDGIYSLGGFLAYVIGRLFRMKRRATPIAAAGFKLGVENALEIADVANMSRGFGSGRNVWEMAERFGVFITQVEWEMLDKVEHKPIVVVRLKRD